MVQQLGLDHGRGLREKFFLSPRGTCDTIPGMSLRIPFFLLALLSSVLFTTAAPASSLPEAVIPAGVGINIHFTRGHEQDLDLMAAAGIKFVRQDLYWAGTEPRKGEYDWSEFDDLLTQLDRRGMHAYLILDYSHPLYEHDVTATNPITGETGERTTASPQHPESIAAFANWAAAAARHFHGRGVIWEIWNEPNISFWQPKPDVEQYTALALATCRAVRAADPDATIVAPASSEFPWPFLERFFQSGALEYLDAVSVHPYRPPQMPPETAAADFQRLRALIAKYAPAGKKNLPILSGEWGYSTHSKGGVTLDQQANFIARQQLSDLLCGVPLSIWYDWKNDGNDPAENEHNFGTVKPDLAPKPAYGALQTLTRELGGGHLERRFDTGNTNDFVLLFRTGGEGRKLAAWTIAKARNVSLPLAHASTNQLAWINGAGQRGTMDATSGSLPLALDGTPKYIDLRGADLPAK